jgi:hypothetical protein
MVTGLRNPQGRHVPPPQSVPVSEPFSTPSEQVAARQTLVVHTWLKQSRGRAQESPAAHPEQDAPPQSAEVSAPFFTPSEQLGARQRPPTQTSLVQSIPVLQP